MKMQWINVLYISLVVWMHECIKIWMDNQFNCEINYKQVGNVNSAIHVLLKFLKNPFGKSLHSQYNFENRATFLFIIALE